MRRWVAVLFLVLVAFYFGSAVVDRCDERPSGEAQVCHILCNDGCATAPLSEPPQAPPPDPLPTPAFESEHAEHLTSLDIEPEKTPPRV